MQKGKTLGIIIVSMLVGAILAFAVQAGIHQMGGGKVSIDASEYEHLKYMDEKYGEFEELSGQIKNLFYKDITDEELREGMLRGLFAGTGDPWTAYMNKEEYEYWNQSIEGSFEGVGVVYTINEGGAGYLINQVYPDSPAEQAGLEKGDIMLKVDGETYDDIDIFGAHLRGPAGTEVELTYSRDGKENTVTMIRAKIEMISVESEILDGNIGYIKITSFDFNTYDKFRAALDEMESKKVKGVIIDLRDNGGGLVMQAQKVADDLLPECEIYYTQDGSGHEEHYSSDADKTDLPYVLLVNENTASASEILTAAIQDNDGGKIVGTKTFGKGVIQIDKALPGGDGYKITIMQYFSPKGNTIHEVGITPDIEVEGEDAQLKKAEDLLK